MVNETLEKYGVYRASYYDWKKKFEQMSEEGFTHGMTPAQQKRIRGILSQKLKRYSFWSLEGLEQTLVLFYEKYNNHRLRFGLKFAPDGVLGLLEQRFGQNRNKRK